jgi:hypothetical protein
VKFLFVWLLVSAPCCSFAQVPASDHVFLVIEENHGYSDVVGSPQMPFLNQLASTNGLATQYFADVHPSIGNYFMLTTGQVITSDNSFSGIVTGDNIVRELLLAGKTWKMYAEDLPQVGYLGPDNYPYVRRHNPLAYFSDTNDTGMQASNLVPFTQFPVDLANQAFPNYSFLVPNIEHDAHPCVISRPGCDDASLLTAADQWLQTNLSPLLLSPLFQPGGDGLLIVVFDEGLSQDHAHGGGHVAAILVGPKVVPETQSSAFHQHQDLLHLICTALGISSCPGLAAAAPDLQEFFPITPPPAVPVSLPAPASSMSPPPGSRLPIATGLGRKMR